MLVAVVPGTFQDYETSEEESVERPRKRDLYGFVDHSQHQQRSHRNEFAPRRLSQLDGNMNGWLLEDEDEDEVERNEVDSDLESTASSKKMLQTDEVVPSISNNNENPDVYIPILAIPIEYDGKGGA
ncbi:hypothetical protein Tco_0647005 [Tanacetum coccineum]